MIGRTSALEEICSNLDAALHGAGGSSIFVLGEAGVGKSRLAQEAIAEARRRQLSVLTGRAVEFARQVAFRPFTQALLSYFRDSGPLDLPELAPFRPILGRLVPEWRDPGATGIDDSTVLLAEAIVRLLRSVGRSRGCLLVLEDLHWADIETISIVEYLADSVGTEPIVFLCTLRPEPSPGFSLMQTLAGSRRASVIELERLGTDDVAAMAQSCLGVAEVPGPTMSLLFEYAEGLPFLVEELLTSLGAGSPERNASGAENRPRDPEVPFTFAGTVKKRLELIEGAGDTVAAAAVLGKRFDWALLPAVTGRPPDLVLDDLSRAVDCQLLTTHPYSGFEFRHALTRVAVLGQLLPPQRAGLCRRALQALEETHPGLPGELCELAASLAEASEDPLRAAELLLEAGARARERGALATAEATLDHAASLGGGDSSLQARIDDALVEVLSLAGKTDRAFEVGRRLNGLLLPPPQRAMFHVRLARAAVAASRWELADGELHTVRAIAEKISDEALRAMADSIGSHVALGQDRFQEAMTLAREALSIAGDAQLPDIACEALLTIGRCARTWDLERAEAAFEQARMVADRNGLPLWGLRALLELCIVDLYAGRPRDRLLTVREQAAASGALALVATVDFMLGAWFRDHSAPDESLQAANRSAEAARRFHLHALLGMALAVQAVAYALRGERDAMEAKISEAMAAAPGDPEVAALCWEGRATLSLLDENVGRAETELETEMEYLRSCPKLPLPGRGLWALLRMVRENNGDAALAELRSSGVTAVHHINRSYAEFAEAVSLGRRSLRSEAEAAFEAADRTMAGFVWMRQHARRLVAEAALVDGWGEPVVWLREALAFFEESGHERIASTCRRLLARSGAPVPRRRGSDESVPFSLRGIGVTDREMEVVKLLGEGLTNRQIAERLYLSPRTVERHIANLTVKSKLRTRAELMVLAARIEPIGTD